MFSDLNAIYQRMGDAFKGIPTKLHLDLGVGKQTNDPSLGKSFDHA